MTTTPTDLSTRAWVLVLAAGIVAHLAALQAASAVNALWWDEYFSIWASEPSLPFGELFRDRIAPDSNLPTYFSLLAIARRFGLESVLAGRLINSLFTAAAVLYVVRRGVVTGRPLIAAVAAAAWLVSAPAIAFGLELRVYGPALATTLAAAWVACETALPGHRPPPVWHMALIGALAASTHLYGGLAAGALAAGALLVTRTGAGLWRGPLAMGLAASLVTGTWLVWNFGSSYLVSHILFSVLGGILQVFSFLDFSLGHLALLPFVVIALVVMRRDAGTRPVASLALVAIGLFILLPALASFAKPILTTRYLYVGAPILTTALAFALVPGAASQTRQLAVVTLVLLSAVGAFTGIAFVAAKFSWKGHEIVAAMAKDCPAGSIKVNRPFRAEQNEPWRFGLAMASGLPASTFAVTRDGNAPDFTGFDCPVLAWVVHVWTEDAVLPDAAVLGPRFGFDINPATRPAVIATGNGYVVLKRP